QNHRVFLQVVAFAADVRNHFVTVGQANLGNITQSRVRLLRGGGVDAGANTTTLRAVLKSRALAFDLADFARLAHELTDGWHSSGPCCGPLRRAIAALNRLGATIGFHHRVARAAWPLVLQWVRKKPCTKNKTAPPEPSRGHIKFGKASDSTANPKASS